MLSNISVQATNNINAMTKDSIIYEYANSTIFFVLFFIQGTMVAIISIFHAIGCFM